MNMTTNEKWLHELTLELRMREVDGATIGDAVAQARTHVEESGESASEAFGSPQEYADALALPASASAQIDRSWLGRLVASSLAGLVAITLVTPTVVGFRLGVGVPVTWGMVCSLVVFAAIIVALPPALDFIIKHLVMGAALFAFALASLVAFNVLLGFTAFVLPPWGAAIVVLAGLAVSVLAYPAIAADPIIDPTQPRAEAPRPPRVGRWVWVIAATLFAALGMLG